MFKIKSSRLILALASLAAVSAVFSASALAVGAPKEVTAPWPINESWGINHAEYRGLANPNGAETTVTLEYREPGTTEFKAFGSENIGSGTTKVTVQRLFNGLKPLATYGMRTKATNSFGTVYSSVYSSETPYWLVEKATTNHIASFVLAGTATFTWKMGGVNVKIACNQTGSGTFGGENGTGTGSTIKFSNCAEYQEEKLICKATAGPSPINLDQAYLSSDSGKIGFIFPEGCFYGEMTMTSSEQFTVALPNFNLWPGQTSQPMTLTKKFQWTGYTVNATISTSMSLVGEDIGKKFGALRME